VLVGDPPCQAYSLAGRSRMMGNPDFESDERHFLYREYLKIIIDHQPPVFVMENVKRLLSPRHFGNQMFEKIIADLSLSADELEYKIRSFTKRGNSDSLKPSDHLIRSEHHGIPQSRYRVILLGIQKGQDLPQHQLLRPVSNTVTISQTIDGLPKIRNSLSREESLEAWRKAVPTYLKGWRAKNKSAMVKSMRTFAAAATNSSTGGASIQKEYRRPKKPTELQQWLHDRCLGNICQHEVYVKRGSHDQ